MKIVDLSRDLYHRTPSYPGQPPIIHGVWKTHEEAFAESGNVQGNSVMYLLDARSRRHPHRRAAPLRQDRHADRRVSARELHRAGHLHRPAPHRAARRNHAGRPGSGGEEASGVPIPKKGTVLLCTGHHERTFPTAAYSTDNPGVNVAATEWLAQQGIVHFGIDSMRPGPDGKVNSLVHKACLDLDITHIESLCNLEALIGQGDVPLHRPAAEMARRHRLADPRGRGIPIVAENRELRGGFVRLRTAARCGKVRSAAG